LLRGGGGGGTLPEAGVAVPLWSLELFNGCKGDGTLVVFWRGDVAGGVLAPGLVTRVQDDLAGVGVGLPLKFEAVPELTVWRVFGVVFISCNCFVTSSSLSGAPRILERLARAFNRSLIFFSNSAACVLREKKNKYKYKILLVLRITYLSFSRILSKSMKEMSIFWPESNINFERFFCYNKLTELTCFG
jgi:hypothetical protein